MTDRQPNADAGRTKQSDAVWASARDAYLAGESGDSVAARHGIGRSTFRRHAADEAWRRCDQPTPPPTPFDPDRPAMEEASQLELIDRRVSWALELGDAGAALRWLRMRDRIELRGQRLREAQARAQRRVDQDLSAEIRSVAALARGVEHVAKAELSEFRTQMRRHGLEVEMAKRDSRDSKIQSPVAAPGLAPDAPGISRAERRRRQKYRARHGVSTNP